jgi:putative ABC transport system substrate-binding protein
MRRRRLLVLIGGAVGSLPLGGAAQQPERLRRVGVLIAFPQTDPYAQAIVKTFTEALARIGWVEGKNIRIDYRFAGGNPALFKAYAEELVKLSPDAILTSTAPATLAMREQTRTIPIVFVIVPDPVGLGIVQSIAHPGGNLTGFASYDAAIIGKWLQLLKEAAPRITRVAIMFNPDTAFAPPLDREIASALSFGVTGTLAPVHDDAGIEAAIETEARQPGGALICLPDSFNVTHRDLIVAAATHHGLPLLSMPDFCKAGGLLSYWYDFVELHGEAATYIDRILKGGSPAALPVQYPTKYALMINLKTAKALGLTMPQSLLARADEVIE